MKFSQYIHEEVGMILHLEHLEDLLLSDGLKGFYDFKNIVTKVLAGSNDDIVYSVKIDGSPALYFGTDPLDNKFFISTKSIANKNPKVAKSIQDIVTLFKSEGLQEKLQAAFKYLSKIHINPDTVYQGDIIFTQPDKQNVTIDGIDYITFKPNVLTYAVSKSLPMYDNIKSAKFGIVVHIMYKITKREEDGFTLATQPYNFKSITSQSGGDLFITSPIIKGVAVDNDNDILDRIDLLEKDVIKSIGVLADLERRDEQISIYFSTFVNAQLDKPDLGIFGDAKAGAKFTGDKYFGELVNWMISAYDKDAGVKNAGEIKMLKDRMVKVILKNKYNLILVLFVYYNMIKIKSDILSMFDDRNIFSKTFKDVEGKLQSTGGEGIVILSGSSIIKLVDRTTFSAMNRKAHRK